MKSNHHEERARARSRFSSIRVLVQFWVYEFMASERDTRFFIRKRIMKLFGVPAVVVSSTKKTQENQKKTHASTTAQSRTYERK